MEIKVWISSSDVIWPPERQTLNLCSWKDYKSKFSELFITPFQQEGQTLYFVITHSAPWFKQNKTFANIQTMMKENKIKLPSLSLSSGNNMTMSPPVTCWAPSGRWRWWSHETSPWPPPPHWPHYRCTARSSPSLGLCKESNKHLLYLGILIINK